MLLACPLGVLQWQPPSAGRCWQDQWFHPLQSPLCSWEDVDWKCHKWFPFLSSWKKGAVGWLRVWQSVVTCIQQPSHWQRVFCPVSQAANFSLQSPAWLVPRVQRGPGRCDLTLVLTEWWPPGSLQSNLFNDSAWGVTARRCYSKEKHPSQHVLAHLLLPGRGTPLLCSECVCSKLHVEAFQTTWLPSSPAKSCLCGLHYSTATLAQHDPFLQKLFHGTKDGGRVSTASEPLLSACAGEWRTAASKRQCMQWCNTFLLRVCDGEEPRLMASRHQSSG